MKAVPRHLESQLRTAARSFAAVVLTGPRRCGKTWLLRRLFPKASYWLFEDPDLIARFRADPHGVLDDIQTPAILDEVQNIPEIFDYLRARIDRMPRRVGQWFLTGSQESGLMRNVSESMTGRAAILHLAPISFAESDRVSVLRGGFPEVLARPKAADIWFSSYLQTYLERDVRSVSAVQDLAKFRRFLALLATRHGQLLNRTDLAAPLGTRHGDIDGKTRSRSTADARCNGRRRCSTRTPASTIGSPNGGTPTRCASGTVGDLRAESCGRSA